MKNKTNKQTSRQTSQPLLAESTQHTEARVYTEESRDALALVWCEIMVVILTDGNTNLDKVHIHAV